LIQSSFLKKRLIHERHVIEKRTLSDLQKIKKKFNNLLVYDHHTAHAASAAYSSGWKDCYVLTIDGWGDNSSSKLFNFYNGNFKLIDWELSFSLSKQVNGFYFTKNGNILYNHPIKFYYTGIPYIVNKLIFAFELLLDKDMRKLKSPIKIREIIDESFNYLNKNKFFYFKYSDYFAFALVHIYIAEKNNLNISYQLINPILNLFNIKLI
jgi:hypothetical protein